MWIPNNHHIADQDSREDAIAYVTRLSDGRACDPELIETYVDSAPEAQLYLEEHTGYQSEPHLTLDDYYSVIGERIPGVRPFPRSVAVKPYPAAAELGEELANKINKGPWVPPVEVSFPEARRGEVGREELAKRRREVWRAKGGGLIAPLLKGLVEHGVEVRTETPAVKLVADGAGSVIGVVVGDRRDRIGARKGVVLACGGFEWNAEMVQTYIGYEVKPMTPWSNTGDGHLMAMEVGAKMGAMTTFFSYGVVYEPWEKGRDGNPLPQMIMGLGPARSSSTSRASGSCTAATPTTTSPHPFSTFDQRNPGFTNKPPAWIVFGAAAPGARDPGLQAGHLDQPDRAGRPGGARVAPAGRLGPGAGREDRRRPRPAGEDRHPLQRVRREGRGPRLGRPGCRPTC